MTNQQKDKAMRYKMTVKKAKELEPKSYVITPQHSTGLLLVHMIERVEEIDDGKWIEITTEDGRKHLVSPDAQLLVVYYSQLNGEKMETIKQSIIVEEGMERLASFIQDTHGSQDWENAVYNLQDYLAAFIGGTGKEVYRDLMGRLEDIKAK
ncbi:hypothetical protein ACFL9T_22655 [Thermodesulfobacteriota bacterium]